MADLNLVFYALKNEFEKKLHNKEANACKLADIKRQKVKKRRIGKKFLACENILFLKFAFANKTKYFWKARVRLSNTRKSEICKNIFEKFYFRQL